VHIKYVEVIVRNVTPVDWQKATSH